MTPEVSTEKLRELMAALKLNPWRAGEWLIGAIVEDETGKTLGQMYDGKLADYVVAMHEALPALLADRERNDWLEQNHRTVVFAVNRNQWYVVGKKAADAVSFHGTLREAVDAARERDAQGGKG